MATDKELHDLHDAFREVVCCGTPIRFGNRRQGYEGWHDDNQGIQWNIGTDSDGLSPYLGVNLEGMKYDGWPIARLIMREVREPQLPRLAAQLRHSRDIHAYLWRDAWQAAGARVQIVERNLGGMPMPLRDLTEREWTRALGEARSCLIEDADSWHRARETVTLLQSRRRVERETTPHIQFRLQPWARSMPDRDARISAMCGARDQLQPIYDFVRRRSASIEAVT